MEKYLPSFFHVKAVRHTNSFYKTIFFCICIFSHVQLFVTPWNIAHQAPLSMGFSRQEYWSGLPFSTPGDLLNPGNKPVSLSPPALASRFFTTVPTGKPLNRYEQDPNPLLNIFYIWWLEDHPPDWLLALHNRTFFPPHCSRIS